MEDFEPWSPDHSQKFKFGCNRETWIRIMCVLGVLLIIDLTALYIIRTNRLEKANKVYREVIPAEPTIILDSRAAPETVQQLVSVQVLFRGGATDDVYYSDVFKYYRSSDSKLNPRGVENSLKLGQWLKWKYVDTGFLNQDDSSNIGWITYEYKRNDKTMKEVNRGMFNEEDVAKKNKYIAWEIHRSGNCVYLYDNHRKNYPTCINKTGEYDLHKCMFEVRTGKTIDLLEKHQLKANQYKNGISLNETDPNAVMHTVAEFESVRWTFNDKRYIRVQSSYVINMLIDNMNASWKSYKDGTLEIETKFVPCSVDDYAILGLLHASGFLNGYGSDTLPQWNSMLIYELWEIDNQPVVRIFYKKDEVKTDLIDYSTKIRGCEQIGNNGCSMESFVRSFDDYRDTVKGQTCNSFRN